MERIFLCPCHAAKELKSKIHSLKIMGLADDVLYRTIVLMEDENDPIDPTTNKRTQYGVRPCTKCDPPEPGQYPQYMR